MRAAALARAERRAGRRAQAHLLDAFIASFVLLFFAVACMSVLSKPSQAPPPEPPGDALAALARDPSFVRAVYKNDSVFLAQHVRAFVGSRPFKLTVCSSNGDLLLKVGEDVEGVAAVVVLSGYNGDVNRRYVGLVVKS